MPLNICAGQFCAIEHENFNRVQTHINLPHLTGIKDYKKIQNRTINWVRVKAKTKEHHRQTKFIKDTKIYSSTSQNKAKRFKKIYSIKIDYVATVVSLQPWWSFAKKINIWCSCSVFSNAIKCVKAKIGN